MGIADATLGFKPQRQVPDQLEGGGSVSGETLTTLISSPPESSQRPCLQHIAKLDGDVLFC